MYLNCVVCVVVICNVVVYNLALNICTISLHLCSLSTDINECRNETLNLCSAGSTCVNSLGGYKCECPMGTQLENDLRTCAGKH